MALFNVIAPILVALCGIGAIWYVCTLKWDFGTPDPPRSVDEPPLPVPPVNWTEPLLTSTSDLDWDAELAQLVEQEGASTSIEAFHRWASRMAKVRDAE
jgi:hypothetical protein